MAHVLGSLHTSATASLVLKQFITALYIFNYYFFFNVKIKCELKEKQSCQADDLARNTSNLSSICAPETSGIYEEEAEQSRLMAAISAGKKLFQLLFCLLNFISRIKFKISFF